MKDSTKISNQHTEIAQAAKTMDVPAYVIQSNDRESVYEWIKMNKGKKLAIQF